MRSLNFGQDADDYHEPHRPVRLRKDVHLDVQEKAAWLALLVGIDVLLVFALIWRLTGAY